jgi:hypothetical protein
MIRFYRGRRVAGVSISACGGEVKIIASIEDPVVMRKILEHQGRMYRHFQCL